MINICLTALRRFLLYPLLKISPKPIFSLHLRSSVAQSSKEMASPCPLHLSPCASPSHSQPRPQSILLTRSNRPQFKCQAGQTGFFSRLGRLIKEKAKSDVEKIFSGFSKTRENLAVIDELLLYWNLADTDRVLDELEEVSHPSRAPRIKLSNFIGKKTDN